MHILRPRQNQLQTSKKIQVKLWEELRSQDSQCLYALIGTDEVRIAKNVTKFNLRITAKCHARSCADRAGCHVSNHFATYIMSADVIRCFNGL